MLSTIQTRYSRVEKALDALIESVAAYNPSIPAADELVEADDAASECLEDRRPSPSPSSRPDIDQSQWRDTKPTMLASLHCDKRQVRLTTRSSRPSNHYPRLANS